MRRVHDEFNPHIVWGINRDIPVNCGDVYDYDRKRKGEVTRDERIRAMAAEFIAKYDQAHAIILKAASDPDCKFSPEQAAKECDLRKPFVPLAYRLNVLHGHEVPLDQDDLSREKFGGLPDLYNKVLRIASDRAAQWDMYVKSYDLKTAQRRLGSQERPKPLTIRRALEKAWPKCGCCNSYMRFVAQLNYSDWASAIHICTRKSHPQWHGMMSAFGFGQDHEQALPNEWHMYFYCPCNQWDNSNHDCAVVRTGANPSRDDDDEDFNDGKQEKPKPLYSMRQYKRAVTAFMKRHGIHPDKESTRDDMAGYIPLEFVEGYELGFDLDWVGFDMWDMERALREEMPESKHRSRYTLFGEARSQQTPRRYMTFKGYETPMRMSPLLNWTDNEHDFTYQIYGDFRTAERFGPPLQGKIDGSCT